MIATNNAGPFSTEPLSIANALHVWIRNSNRKVFLFLHFYDDSVTLRFKVARTGAIHDCCISHEKGISIAAKAVGCGMILEVLQ